VHFTTFSFDGLKLDILKTKGPISKLKKYSTKKTSDNIQTSPKSIITTLSSGYNDQFKETKGKTKPPNFVGPQLKPIINFHSLNIYSVFKITLNIHKAKQHKTSGLQMAQA
jgi:hypothetical protein